MSTVNVRPFSRHIGIVASYDSATGELKQTGASRLFDQDHLRPGVRALFGGRVFMIRSVSLRGSWGADSAATVVSFPDEPQAEDVPDADGESPLLGRYPKRWSISDDVLRALQLAVAATPPLRIGQLLVNVIGRDSTTSDIFYRPDAVLLADLLRWIAEHTGERDQP